MEQSLFFNILIFVAQGPHTIHFLAEQPLLVVFFITLVGTIIACGISTIVQTNLLRQGKYNNLDKSFSKSTFHDLRSLIFFSDSKAITELHDAGNLITLVGDVAINEEFGEPRLEIEKMDSQENVKENLIEKKDIKCASKGDKSVKGIKLSNQIKSLLAIKIRQDMTRQDMTRQNVTRQD